MQRVLLFLMVLCCCTAAISSAGDKEIHGELRTPGVLHHLGIPYAQFVTGSGDGFDVELIQEFAADLGLSYRFVPSTWTRVIGDLTGVSVNKRGNGRVVSASGSIRGDVIASGFTVLPWRSEVVRFSEPVFPTQVWLVTRMESSLRPIEPSGSIGRDIELVKDKLQGHSVLGVVNTCLDPRQYLLQDHAKSYVLFYGNVNDLAPALLAGEADTVLLDAPDAIVAMRNWPGKLKIIGPVSRKQVMAVAFRSTDEHLCRAFNGYLGRIRRSGRYMELVDRYYPEIKQYFPKFFKMDSSGDS